MGSVAHTLNQFDFSCFILVWASLLLPVPFSRVVLNDHSPKQVFVGGFIGIVEGILFFALVRLRILPKINHLLGKRIGYIFVHDFPLPVYNVVSKCYILLAQSSDDTYEESNLQQES